MSANDPTATWAGLRRLLLIKSNARQMDGFNNAEEVLLALLSKRAMLTFAWLRNCG
jgi:hypothetical protein